MMGAENTIKPNIGHAIDKIEEIPLTTILSISKMKEGKRDNSIIHNINAILNTQ